MTADLDGATDRLPTIGLAFSGGGHRAALWALGGLLYLADAGKLSQVTTVSSVSGGSITNGVLAAASLDLSSPTVAAETRAVFSDLIRVAAHDGLIAPGPSTDGWLGRTLALTVLTIATPVVAVACRLWQPAVQLAWLWVAAGTATCALLAWVGTRWLFTRWRDQAVGPTGAGVLLPVLLTVLSLLGFTALPVSALSTSSSGLAFAVVGAAATAVLCGLTAKRLAQRSAVAEQALAKRFFSVNGTPLRLSDVASTLEHVFCATELQSGRQFYMSPKFTYGYDFGVGTSTSLTLARAVQSSACFPGGFNSRRIDATAIFPAPPSKVAVLADGGVYDNMGEQWLTLGRRRGRRTPHPQLADKVNPPVEEMVVINASALPGFVVDAKRGFLSRELGDLSTEFTKIMYEQTTAGRRYNLVDAWDRAERTGLGQAGVLVHIAQSPATVATEYATRAASTDPITEGRRGRAQSVLSQVVNGADMEDWDALATSNANVGTTLGPIGAAAAGRLLFGGYLTAGANAHIIRDYPQPPNWRTVLSDIAELVHAAPEDIFSDSYRGRS